MRIEVGRCLIPDILRRLNMSQQQLADKIGMNKRQLSRYCTSDIECMALPTAVLIADTLGCSPRDLYEWFPVRRRKR